MKDSWRTAELERLLQGPLRLLSEGQQELFAARLAHHFSDVVRPLRLLYGARPDFDQWLGKFLDIVAHNYARRPSPLHHLDLQRTIEQDWHQQSTMLGYVAYTERFAGDLQGVADHIPYLKELGVTYLHLMPLLRPRPAPNDGGYAVADYRQVNPVLGDMADLAELAAQLRANEISLCIDLVCNHTAKEHDWAQRALAGDPIYQDYYLMFLDRKIPDEYEKTLPEVFPDFAPGNFSYYPSIERWVWTTFHEYQWDLNYRNPAVFAAMLDTILFLANQGVEILRLDAVAFMWKRLGTDSQNQPEVHSILRALRALSRLAAPAFILKAEAIVSPDKLLPYFGQGLAANKECELAYHNAYMVLLWSSLAERQVRLMTHALQQMPVIPSNCAWITYVRCHDDIGWAVRDEDALAVGLDGRSHRAFLSDFYCGHFPATFARGATFQYNPRTGDRRISGSLASLAGLQAGLENQDWNGVDLAIRRILLLHNMIFAFGGIPAIYMGDEIGLLNDPGYRDHPELAGDNRWLHRPFMNWEQTALRHNWQTIPGRIFQGLLRLITARKQAPVLHAEASTQPVWVHNDQVFGLIRSSARGRILILGNFSEAPQTVSRGRLQELQFSGSLRNLLDDQVIAGWADAFLEPYGTLWLEQKDGTGEV